MMLLSFFEHFSVNPLRLIQAAELGKLLYARSLSGIRISRTSGVTCGMYKALSAHRLCIDIGRRREHR